MRTGRLHQVRGGANDVHLPDPPSEDQLWVVCDGAGQLHLVQGRDALKELIAKLELTKTSRVFVLSATSKALGDIPDLEAAFEPASVATASTPEAAAAAPEAPPLNAFEAVLAAPEAVPEPALAGPEPAAPELVVMAVQAPPERVEAAPPPKAAAKAVPEEAEGAPSNHQPDDDFSLLDRPFDDGDYYEESPRARWVRGAGIAAVLIVLGGGGYRLVRSRSAARPATAATVAAAPPAQPAAAAPVTPPSPPAVPVAATTPAPPAATAPAAVPPAAPAAGVAPAAAASSSYSDLVAAGQRQFESGRSRAAQTLFERALAETPDGTAALVGLAYVHLDRGRLPQAIALFQRALGQDRDNPQATFGLAECHRQQGDRRAALAEFNTFLTLQPTGGDADMARRLVQELSSGG